MRAWASLPFFTFLLFFTSGVCAQELKPEASLRRMDLENNWGYYTKAKKRGKTLLPKVRKIYAESAPLRVAQLLAKLATAESGLGRFEPAESYALEAASIVQRCVALPACPKSEVGELRTRLKGTFFNIYWATERFEKALNIQRELLNRYSREKNIPGIVGVKTGLAHVYRLQGQLDEAQKLLSDVNSLLPKDTRHKASIVPRAEYYLQLGRLNTRLGFYEKAREFYEKAVTLLGRSATRAHVTALILVEQGTLLFNLGYQKLGIQTLEEALEIQKKKEGEDIGHNPIIARTLSHLGNLFRRLSEPSKAKPLQLQALKIREQSLGKTHDQTNRSCIDLGRTYLALKQYKEAESYFQRAYKSWSEAKKPKVASAGLAATQLGALYFAWGKEVDAERYFKKGLDLLDQSLGRLHPTTAEARNEYGVFSASTGEKDVAWKSLKEGTQDYFRWVNRLLASSTRHEQYAILGQRRSALFQFLSLANAAKKLSQTQLQELYGALLGWKGASARSLLDRQEALSVGKDPEAIKIFNELKAARQELVRVMMYEDGAVKSGSAGEAIKKISEKCAQLELDLARKTASYARWKEKQVGTLTSIAKKLGPSSALIEFVKYRDLDFAQKDRPLVWGAHRYGAFVIWAEKEGTRLRWVDLGAAKALETVIQTWRKLSKKGVVIARKTEPHLRQRLWNKLTAVFPQKKLSTLLVAPDGELGLLPFEAIRLQSQEYVIDKYQVRYLASGLDLASADDEAENAKENQPVVVLGDPDFDHTGPRTAAQKNPSPFHLTSLKKISVQNSAPRFSTLAGFKNEASHLKDQLTRLKPKWPIELKLGTEASEESLVSLKQPRILYFITHGYFQPNLRPRLVSEGSLAVAEREGAITASVWGDPRLRSGLALAGANLAETRAKQGKSDGLLTGMEAEGLDLRGTELVVLSACETNVGTVEIGEGVLGLRHSFQLAGARSVLASLWKVPDKETEFLMKRFFELWLSGNSKPTAFWKAQRELLNQLRVTSPDEISVPPKKWAGFVFHGVD